MDFGEFLTLPSTMFLLAIIVGSILTIVIISSSKRSRKSTRRPEPKVKRRALDRLGVGDFIRGELPDKPLQPAAWTVPPELRGLPEPDLDMLSVPIVIKDLESEVRAEPASYSQNGDAGPAKA